MNGRMDVVWRFLKVAVEVEGSIVRSFDLTEKKEGKGKGLWPLRKF